LPGEALSMRGWSIVPKLVGLAVAMASPAASAHGHGGCGHHASGSASRHGFAPVYVAPAYFGATALPGMLRPASPYLYPTSYPTWPPAQPALAIGWGGGGARPVVLPAPGRGIGGLPRSPGAVGLPPSPGASSVDATRAEEARESDIDRQIQAHEEKSGPSGGSGDPVQTASPDTGAWQPL
jgi:hypothetical protein